MSKLVLGEWVITAGCVKEKSSSINPVKKPEIRVNTASIPQVYEQNTVRALMKPCPTEYVRNPAALNRFTQDLYTHNLHQRMREK